MKLTILVLASLALFSCTSSPKADKQFVLDVIRQYQSKSTIDYDFIYKIKTFDDDDTLVYKGNCNLIRDVKDTIFGGSIWYDISSEYTNSVRDTASTRSKYYNGNNLFLIDNKKMAATKFDPFKGETYPITSSFDGEVIKTAFLQTDKLRKRLEDKTIQHKISDTLLSGEEHAVLALNIPTDDTIQKQIKTYYINKTSRLITKITYYTTLADQHQYNEWNLSNIKFNTVSKAALAKRFNGSKYKITTFVQPEVVDPLDNGTTAPDFKAFGHPDREVVDLRSLRDEVVVLDFWYTSCQPCALAVPGLNKLQERYRGKIRVVGVNPYEKDEKKEKIDAFIKRNNVEYDLVFVDYVVAEQYGIPGYPTLYVIDKNGIIRYSSTGYSDDNPELIKVIDELVK